MEPEAAAVQFRLVHLEIYRGTDVIDLSFPAPCLLSSPLREQILREVSNRCDERTALLVDYQNVSHALADPSGSEPSEAALEVDFRAGEIEGGKQLVAVLRYHPGSLTSMIRTMAAHLYARMGLGSSFAPDRELAIRAARRAIDHLEALEKA